MLTEIAGGDRNLPLSGKMFYSNIVGEETKKFGDDRDMSRNLTNYCFRRLCSTFPLLLLLICATIFSYSIFLSKYSISSVRTFETVSVNIDHQLPESVFIQTYSKPSVLVAKSQKVDVENDDSKKSNVNGTLKQNRELEGAYVKIRQNHYLNKTIVPRRYMIDGVGFQKYKAYLTKVEPLLPKQTKAVIILTNHRSGSSFFGELFNQHPDAFYFFEPLLPLSVSGDCGTNSELKTRVLSELVQCQFTDWKSIYRSLPYAKRMKKSRTLYQCIMKNMCFASKTKEMCEDRHCPRGRPQHFIDCWENCGIVNPTLAMNDCRRKKLVVLKLIRVCDILEVENLVRKLAVDIKIIHLIRDPRGIANSRQSIMRNLHIRDSLSHTCSRQRHNLYSGAIDTPEWLKGRYKLVRYEDVATFPYRVARSVYDFIGMSFPDSIKEWIAENTDIDHPTNSNIDETATYEDTIDASRGKRAVVPSNLVKQFPKRINPYSTNRNSTATVQKWVIRMPFTVVIQIQSVCKEVMDLMGYVPVSDPYGYKDKTRKYFLSEIPVLSIHGARTNVLHGSKNSTVTN